MLHKLSNAFGKVFLTIQVDTKNRWVHIIWEGYLSEAHVREGALAVSEAVLESGFSCILNDMQLVLGPIRSSEWAVRVWAPQVAKQGLKHMALVNAPDAMSAPDIAKFHTDQSHFETGVFVSIHEARTWLYQHCH